MNRPFLASPWSFLIVFTLALPSVTAAAMPIPLQALPADDTIGVAPGGQLAPSIAQGAGALLVAWADDRANPTSAYEYETSSDIYGVRLDSVGDPLDPIPFPITRAPAAQKNPKIAWNGTNWLVVFETVGLGGTGYYYEDGLAAVRVTADGEILDPNPIPIIGAVPSGFGWAVASDGDNWVVVNQGSSASNDVFAFRISPEGVLLDPPTRSILTATHYMRSNFKLAHAGGVFLMTFNDRYSGGTYDTKVVRFDSGLDRLDAEPLPLLATPLSAVVGHGGEFYAVWHRQRPDYSVGVFGSRLNTEGEILDGGGVDISRGNPPQAYGTTGVVWDGLNWKVTWWNDSTVHVARVDSLGRVLDPGGIAAPGLQAGPTAGTGDGGVQLVWSDYENGNYDVFGGTISADGTAAPKADLSLSAPAQIQSDVATNGSGYMVVYRSDTGTGSRILAQPLDAGGVALTATPVELASGVAPSGLGAPAVAWNGSVYMASWGDPQGVVAQRLLPDGTRVDPQPFVVLGDPAFGPADVEALGETFLVVGLRCGTSCHWISPLAARVSGADGTILDPTPISFGYIFAGKPRITVLGGRWLVAWQDNLSHDDPLARTLGVFISADGTVTENITLHDIYSSTGGNSIFGLGLASSGDVALLVQSQEITSGVETDLLGVRIHPDGTVAPYINLTPWSGNQYRPQVAWDGTHFVIVYQDQKNRLAVHSLEQLDARGDIFGMRVSHAGAIIDPQGFVVSASPTAESHPDVAASGGVSLVSASLLVDDSVRNSYRITYGLVDMSDNQWPVAVAGADIAGGDIPLSVSFSASGSHDPDGVTLSHAWDFGDGATSAEPNPSHTFTEAGAYVVTLTVTDDQGASNTQTLLVKATLPNQPPVAVAEADPVAGVAPLSVVFYADASYDPDGSIGNIQWDFGGGWEYWGSPAYHTFTRDGIYEVVLTVRDDQGATGTDTILITVGDPPVDPVLRSTSISFYSRDQGSDVHVLGGVQVEDGDGTAVEGAIVYAYWTLPDGTHKIRVSRTNGQGTGWFFVQSGPGTTSLTVVTLYKGGYTFDPEGSVLSRSMTR